MRAVDANVLVRLTARDDPRQTASAESFVCKGAWVSVPAPAEAMRVPGGVCELSAPGQARAVEILLENRQLALQEREIVAAALEL